MGMPVHSQDGKSRAARFAGAAALIAVVMLALGAAAAGKRRKPARPRRIRTRSGTASCGDTAARRDLGVDRHIRQLDAARRHHHGGRI